MPPGPPGRPGWPWPRLAGAVHALAIPLFLGVGGVLAALNHTRFDVFLWLPLVGAELFDSKAHDTHHAKFTCNYAQYTMLWDKIFGTYVGYEPDFGKAWHDKKPAGSAPPPAAPARPPVPAPPPAPARRSGRGSPSAAFGPNRTSGEGRVGWSGWRREATTTQSWSVISRGRWDGDFAMRREQCGTRPPIQRQKTLSSTPRDFPMVDVRGRAQAKRGPDCKISVGVVYARCGWSYLATAT